MDVLTFYPHYEYCPHHYGCPSASWYYLMNDSWDHQCNHYHPPTYPQQALQHSLYTNHFNSRTTLYEVEIRGHHLQEPLFLISQVQYQYLELFFTYNLTILSTLFIFINTYEYSPKLYSQPTQWWTIFCCNPHKKFSTHPCMSMIRED